MKIAVFDVDDTLIIHGQGSQNYYKTFNSNFKELLDSKNFDKIYIYTNGTYGHGFMIAHHLNIYDDVSFIYGRDNLQPMIYPRHMKPHRESFEFVNSSILVESGLYGTNQEYEIYFFDDLKNNLRTAKEIGWKTVLIKPDGTEESYIDHVYSNIYSALINL